MARLPQSLQLATPRGTSPSMDVPAPTDLGLGAAADALAGYAATKKKVDDQLDAREAQTLIDKVRQGYEPEQAKRAAEYDGAQPGYARSELDRLESDARGVLDGETRVGVRNAAYRQLDDYKAKVGDHVLAVESTKRAEPARLEAIARDDLELSTGVAAYVQAMADAQKARRQDSDPSLHGWAAGSLEDHDAAAAKALAAVPESQRPRLQVKLNALRPGVIASASDAEEKGRVGYVVTTYKANVGGLANGVLTEPSLFDAAVAQLSTMATALPGDLREAATKEATGTLAIAQIEGLTDRGDYDIASRFLTSGKFDKFLPEGAKERLTNNIATAARVRAAGEAASYDGDASTAPGFAAASEFLIDHLEGGAALVENDNGKGATRFGINQTANPDVNVRGLTRAGAEKVYKARYWDAIGADKLPPGLALAAFDAAVNQGVDNARKWIGQSGGDLDKFLALREQAYRALAASSPAQAKNLPVWLSRINAVRERSGRINGFLSTEAEFANDPLSYAMGGKSRPALMTVPALPADGAFNPADEAAWATGLRQRQAVGAMLHHDYQNVPERILTNAEAKAYETKLQSDPGAGVQLGAAALRALGPAGAQKLLVEIGLKADVAPAVLHLADLAATNGTTVFGDSAARGFALRAKGESPKGLPFDEMNAEFDKYGKVFARMPEVRLAARQTAEAAMLADRAMGVERPVTYYVNSALGSVRNNGNRYGGPASVNGATTIAPRWLNPDYVDDAVEAAAEVWVKSGVGPVWANGTPMTVRDISRRHLVLQPDGRYLLADPRNGSVAMAKNGAAFLLDMDAGRGWLMQKLGAKAVRPGH